ncbi:MAG: peptide deformylase [Rhabdochlamydiaceae bacterium]|jgi:peptide deformylase
MLLKIYYYGHPILRKRCEPVKEITDEIRKLARDMIETMDKYDGIGLAAPQVGHPIRMFVLRNYLFTEEGHWTLSEPKVYINPKLTNPSEDLVSDTEGCLSLPGLRLHVDRPDKIVIEALDLEGKTFIESLEGYNARIRMHENDHINGVLFIDRVDLNTRKKIEPQLKEMKKKYSSS